MAQVDYDIPAVILQNYNNQQQLAVYTVRQMRGVMNHHNIPFRDNI